VAKTANRFEYKQQVPAFFFPVAIKMKYMLGNSSTINEETEDLFYNQQ
jgi:hypothetical protein